MIEIFEAAAEVQETSAFIEECCITSNMIEDFRDILGEVEFDLGKEAESFYSHEAQEAVSGDGSAVRLDPRSEYFKEDHVYETDDRGVIYKKDGELIPGVEYSSNGGRYIADLEGNIETLQEGYFSTYKERLDRTPIDSDLGTWTGERGESLFIPNTEKRGATIGRMLEEHGLEGIEYRDGNPDFSVIAEETVEIEMTANRLSNRIKGIVGNFEKADAECARQWNLKGKDGRTDWNSRAVSNYRNEHSLSWHENPDRKTCELISQDIHGYFRHLGGFSECVKKEAKDIGGVFDE